MRRPRALGMGRDHDLLLAIPPALAHLVVGLLLGGARMQAIARVKSGSRGSDSSATADETGETQGPQ